MNHPHNIRVTSGKLTKPFRLVINGIDLLITDCNILYGFDKMKSLNILLIDKELIGNKKI